MNIVEQLTYSVDVRFYINLPSKWSHYFDKEPPEEESRIGEILGGGKFVNHDWVEFGVPAKFRVQIIQKANSKIILDESINRPRTSATYMGRYAVLATKTLPTGKYSIRIDYLDGGPELAPLYAKILFARAHHGK